VGKLLGFSGSEPNRASRAPRLVESHEPEIRIEIGSCDMEPSWNRVIDKLISSKSRDRVIDKVISSKSRASTLFDSPRCTRMYFNTYKQVAFFIFLHACNCMHDSTFGSSLQEAGTEGRRAWIFVRSCSCPTPLYIMLRGVLSCTRRYSHVWATVLQPFKVLHFGPAAHGATAIQWFAFKIKKWFVLPCWSDSWFVL
jgi:hypothetical protein